MSKIKIYHFHNGGGGGVLSIISNLLRFSSNDRVENHVIYTINTDRGTGDYPVNQLEGAASERVFYYSSTWNFYYICRQLSTLLPDDKAVIVAHDWLELGMVSHLGLSNPVVQFLHGDYDYYYDLARKHRSFIDLHIVVSKTIAAKLRLMDPERNDLVVYRPHPVPPVAVTGRPKDRFGIIYIVRDINDENKNFLLLPAIDRILVEKGIEVHWTIVGTGKTKEEFGQVWGLHENYTYIRQMPNDKLLELLTGNHLFILPSFNEGFPLTVVESMKAGCVPLISDWKGATAELVISGVSGYYFDPNDKQSYADRIEQIYLDRALLKFLSDNALRMANELFDPYVNTAHIEEDILQSYKDKEPKHPQKVYGSRLDQPWIPNFFTRSIRRLNILK
jgi:glycosyltransferase involved in cell wall biosynthesis